MFAWMPVFFTFLLAGFPAGLVIYWAWNNTLSVLQQSVIMARQGVEIPLWRISDSRSRGERKDGQRDGGGQRAKADQAREKARQERGTCHQSRKRRNTERAEELAEPRATSRLQRR